MDPLTVRAFHDELTKIGEASALEGVKKKLRPGDILVGRLRNPSVRDGAVGKILSFFQEGTKNYHAAMYAGDNRVIDINRGIGVVEKPLEEFSDRYHFKALKVKAPKKLKEEAVAWARTQVGKEFNTLGAIRQALPARKDEGPRKRQEGLDSYFCSQLVSNAYAKLPLGKNRFVGDIRPVDFQKSPLTKAIGEVT